MFGQQRAVQVMQRGPVPCERFRTVPGGAVRLQIRVDGLRHGQAVIPKGAPGRKARCEEPGWLGEPEWPGQPGAGRLHLQKKQEEMCAFPARVCAWVVPLPMRERAAMGRGHARLCEAGACTGWRCVSRRTGPALAFLDDLLLPGFLLSVKELDANPAHAALEGAQMGRLIAPRKQGLELAENICAAASGIGLHQRENALPLPRKGIAASPSPREHLPAHSSLLVLAENSG